MSRKHPRDRRAKMLKLWLRGLRKTSRQEEDAKKALNRRRTFLCLMGKSAWQLSRYLAGVRKGTIL